MNQKDEQIIKDIDALFYKYEYYNEASHKNPEIVEYLDEMQHHFTKDLYQWHLTQPEGIAELLGNPNYTDISEHRCLEDAPQCIEAYYKHIFMETAAYNQVFPWGKKVYYQLVRDRMS